MKTLIEIVAEIHETEKRREREAFEAKLAEVEQESAEKEKEVRENLKDLLSLLARDGVQLQMVLLDSAKPEYGSKPLLVRGNRGMTVDDYFSRTIRDYLRLDERGQVLVNRFTEPCFLTIHKELYEEEPDGPKMSDES